MDMIRVRWRGMMVGKHLQAYVATPPYVLLSVNIVHHRLVHESLDLILSCNLSESVETDSFTNFRHSW